MVKVLLSGATGTIGGQILKNLLAHGHQVTSIVRDQSKAEALASLGEGSSYALLSITAETVGRIAELAKEHDVFIHNAIQFGEEGVAIEFSLTRAILDVGRELEATGRSFQYVYTSGCLALGPTTEFVDETYQGTPIPMVAWRVELDSEIVAASSDLFVTTVVRPVWVYPSSHVDQWATLAKKNGKVQYLAGADGGYVSLIHLEDLANLYRLTVELRKSGYFLATDSNPVTLRQITDKVKEITGVTEEETFDEPFSQIPNLGLFPIAQSLSQKIKTSRAEELGWEVKYPNWLEAPHNF